ncbi:hypothetical protein HYFRA_00010080 [Hymenoscyphus fraxineus]|uniref:Uncharacterized protein n=1 Tax=Hymenoscyphus fraxineus TaxID=746836 RepID=A0A9N9KTZ0_9HELO|nr:hypothetical protein HYFRA_00010080 [Hymenoscyphus fraxineus]
MGESGNDAGGFIIPGGATIKSGGVATVPINYRGGEPVAYPADKVGESIVYPVNEAGKFNEVGKSVVYSVNEAGSLVVSTIGTQSAQTIALPDKAVGGFVIPGGSTIKSGGLPITQPAKYRGGGGESAVFSVDGAGNLVVSTVGGSTATTITPPTVPNGAAMITPLSDPHTIVYQGQTLVLGGSVATIPSLPNVVLSYGPLGLVIQYSSGVAATISVPGVQNGVFVSWTPVTETGTVRNQAVQGSLRSSIINSDGSPISALKPSVPGKVVAGDASSTPSLVDGSGSGKVEPGHIRKLLMQGEQAKRAAVKGHGITTERPETGVEEIQGE